MSKLPGRHSLLELIEAGHHGWRLFVNVVGRGWIGRGPRECAFQYVGWRTVKVTQDMVGMEIAQFATVETRSRGARRLTPEERNFAHQVREAGGFAGVAQRVGGSVAIGEIGEE
jgi:hypothetical protein